MSFEEYEDSYYEGHPERLFLFQMGNVSWPYVASATVVNHLGRDYTPEAIDMGSISQSVADATSTIEIVISSEAAVCRQFIPYQPISPMRVRVYRHHVDDMDGEYRVEMIGRVVSASFDESTKQCSLMVQLTGAYLDRKTPWPVYQKQCNWALYGPGCFVNRLSYQTVATITTVDADEIYSATFDAQPDGWFKNGYVVSPEGEFRFVIDHVGPKLTLSAPFINLTTSQEVEAYAGCDRSAGTCFTKFNNLPRHLGFGWIPQKNPFADSVFGNHGTSSSKSKTDWRKAINPAGWNGAWGLF